MALFQKSVLKKYLHDQQQLPDLKLAWEKFQVHFHNKLKGDQDASELNRSEGYEMLHFINSLANSWKWVASMPVSAYQNLERIIKDVVPSSTRTQEGIKKWIVTNRKKL